jgi:hypothetical protein
MGEPVVPGRSQATVEFAGLRHELLPGAVFTFGRARSCNVCLDPEDRGISRISGSVECVDRVWFVVNRSGSRPFVVASRTGFHRTVLPGEREQVDGRLSIVVEGQVRRHQLVATAPVVGIAELASRSVDEHEGGPTDMGGGVRYSAEDRLALVALFAGYLHPFPRYDPRPRSYKEAADVLGWGEPRLRKKVEYVRDRLIRAGVPNLYGDGAKAALAEHVLASGVIGPDDLEVLPEGRP